MTYPNGKAVSYVYDPAGNLVRRLTASAVAGAAPSASAAGVVNAASFLGGPVAPGEIVTLFGSGIGPAALAGAQITAYNYFDSLAGETSVLFDGIPAPIVYASAGQTAVIVGNSGAEFPFSLKTTGEFRICDARPSACIQESGYV